MFLNGTRSLMVKGLFSVRAANILSAVAVGVDGVAALNEVEKACFSDQMTHSSGAANKCSDYSAQALRRENCVLAAGLTALGVGLSMPAGQRLLAKGVRALKGRGGVDKFLKSKLGRTLTSRMNKKQKKSYCNYNTPKEIR